MQKAVCSGQVGTVRENNRVRKEENSHRSKYLNVEDVDGMPQFLLSSL